MSKNKTRWASMIECAQQYLYACGYIDIQTLKSIGFCDAGLIALRQIDRDMNFISLNENPESFIFYRSGYCTCDNCGDVGVLICDDIAQCSSCGAMQVENKETSEFFAKLAMKRIHNSKKFKLGVLSDGLLKSETAMAIDSILNGQISYENLSVYISSERKVIDEEFNDRIEFDDEKRSKRYEARPTE